MILHEDFNQILDYIFQPVNDRGCFSECVKASLDFGKNLISSN